MSTLMKDRINRPQSLYVPFRDIIQENPVLKPGEIVTAYCDNIDAALDCENQHFNIATKIGDGIHKFGDIPAIRTVHPAYGVQLTDNKAYLYGNNESYMHPRMTYDLSYSFHDIKDNKFISLFYLDLFSTYGLCQPPGENGLNNIDEYCIRFTVRFYNRNFNSMYNPYSASYFDVIYDLPYGFDTFNYVEYPYYTTMYSMKYMEGYTDSVDITRTLELVQTSNYQFYRCHIAIATDATNSIFNACGVSRISDINLQVISVDYL